MDLATLVPSWLDAFLIGPFRWPASAHAGIWLGSACLALYCVVLGVCTSGLLFLAHRRFYASAEQQMVKHHNLSVQALHSGDKDAYLAINRLAHEDFGKSFFARASIGMASLWPLPFTLGWMALRFEGVPLYTLPGTGIRLGYVFVLLTLYIVERVLFPRLLERRLPFFRHIAALREEDRRQRGEMRPFFNPPSASDPDEEHPGRTGR